MSYPPPIPGSDSHENETAPLAGEAGSSGTLIPNDTPETTIRKFLNTLIMPDNVFEVRVLRCADRPGSTFNSTVSGYYQHCQIDAAVRHIVDLDASGTAPVIYVTLNPVSPALLARATNRLKQKVKETTADKDVARRLWLLIDCDPVRPAGVSSTHAELHAAGLKAREIRTFLRVAGWPEPVVVMSGNGVHLLFRIDLLADDGELVKRVLEALASRFDDAAVKIDRSVHNPARITKVAGTIAANKGDNMVGVEGIEDRPHRRSALLSVPGTVMPVSVELLEALVATLPTDESGPDRAAPRSAGPSSSSSTTSGHGLFERFDPNVAGVRGYLERHGVTIKAEHRDGATTHLYLDRCPVVADCQATGDTDIAVIVGDDGKIGYKNLHNRGEGLGWLDVRDALEPGYRVWVESKGWEKGQAAAPSVSSVSTPGGGPPKSWPDPRPLPDALPPVMMFDPSLLPHSFQGWIVDIAERIQCPIDFPAVSSVIGLGALVGRKLGIRPKRQDDWLVVPNLWGGVIGRPGVMKTPAIVEPLRPLKRLEIEAKQQFDGLLKDAAASKRVGEAQKKLTDAQIKKNIKNRDEALRIARESLDDEDECEPVRKRYIVNDSTVEKLGVILNENPSGVLIYRDELIGLLKSLDKQGQEGARSFYLESWNGTGRYTYDRIERGTIDIEAAITSIIGGIQPGPLSQYLRADATGGSGDDGLIQRFQLLVWPDLSKGWINIDRWPDSDARDQAYRVFNGLDVLEPRLLGADYDRFDPDGIPFLRFEDHAQGLFNEWRAGLEAMIRAGDLHPALESHLSKFRSLIPSIGLLIHLADGHHGPVGAEPLAKAIRWSAYLESHARRVYSQAIDPDLAAAKSLAGKLLAGVIIDGFALRDVYRNGWTGLASEADARGAVGYLIDFGWLVEAKKATEGRIATVYYINPKIRGSITLNFAPPPSGPTARTDRSPTSPPNKDPSVSSVGTSGGGSMEIQPDPPPPAPSPENDEEVGEWTA